MDTKTYLQTIDLLDLLPTLVRSTRTSRGLTQRQAARQIGIAQGSLSHFETSKGATLLHVVLILRWLANDLTSANREHAGLGLGCTPCAGPCTLDGPAL